MEKISDKWDNLQALPVDNQVDLQSLNSLQEVLVLDKVQNHGKKEWALEITIQFQTSLLMSKMLKSLKTYLNQKAADLVSAKNEIKNTEPIIRSQTIICSNKSD